MAKSKNNTIIYIGIAAIVVIIAVVVGIVLMNRGDGGDNLQGNETDTSNVTTSDFDTINYVVEYGDYDAMEALAKDIQNGEMTGQVVQIEGDVSHPMSTYSIVEQNADGSGSIGTQFIIDGDADYPEDGTHVIITGKVIEQSPMYFVIQTTPEYVVIVDEVDVEEDADVVDDIEIIDEEEE